MRLSVPVGIVNKRGGIQNPTLTAKAGQAYPKKILLMNWLFEKMNSLVVPVTGAWALIKFLDLEGGRYSRWALIRGWALIKFSPFSASQVCLFCNKTVNATNKTRRVTKQGFCKILWRNLCPQGSLLLELIHLIGWSGGERLFEFDWGEEGVGAYSRLGAY